MRGRDDRGLQAHAERVGEVYLTEYSDVFRLAGPQPLIRPLLAGLGVLGRLRGYRAGGTPAT